MTSAREAVARAMLRGMYGHDVELSGTGDPWLKAAEETIAAILTWLSSNGLVIVPKEPTEEMVVEFCRLMWRDQKVYDTPDQQARAVYRAMLSAAPQPDLGK